MCRFARVSAVMELTCGASFRYCAMCGAEYGLAAAGIARDAPARRASDEDCCQPLE
jgi:hypothetical protein